MKKFYFLLPILLFIFLLVPTSTIVFAEQKNKTDYNTINYKDFNIISENEFYCVNTETNKIEYFFNGSVSSFGENGVDAGQFSKIVFFQKLQNQTFCILDNINKLHFFDLDFSFINSVEYIYYQNSYFPLGEISQITSDIYSNVYLVDKTNNFILKANKDSKNFEVYSSSLILANSQITYLNNSNTFALITEDKLIVDTKEITLSSCANFIFSDAYEYIYLVYPTKIDKYNINLDFIESLNKDSGSNYNIDLENGDIYYILDNEIIKIENFASNLTSYTPPVNYEEATPLNNPIEICYVNTATNLLKTPYSTKSLIKLDKNDKVLKLAKTYNLQTNFSYVLYENGDNQYLGYVEERFLNNFDSQTSADTLIPIRENISAYKYPVNNNNILLENLNSSLTYLKTRTIEFNSLSFFEILLNDNYYYVLENELISSQQNFINLYLQTNSKLNFINFTKEIYVYNNINKEDIIYKINKEVNIKVINTINNMAEIEFISENQIIKGFIENKYLQNQNTFIIPLTIILFLCSTIILLVLIFKFKKQK